MSRANWLVLLLWAAAGCIAGPAWAGSCLGVTPVSMMVTDASSLQQAITAANDGACVDATVLNDITLTAVSSAQPLTGTLTLTGVPSGVQIDGNAGAGFVIGAGGNLISSNLTFKGFATLGNGGVFSVQSGGSLSLNNDVVTQNTAMGNDTVSALGGGIFVAAGGSVTLTNTTLSNNQAIGGTGSNANGGGIDNAGNLILTGSIVQGNTATGGMGATGNVIGGGIYNTGTLTLTNSTLAGNTATGGTGATGNVIGGGIYNTGTLTLTDSTLQGNIAMGATGGTGGNADGGGIYNTGTLTLTGSTTSLISNQALGGGGGVGLGGGIDLNNGLFQLNLGATNPELLVYDDTIVDGTLNLTLISEPILQSLLNEPIKFFSSGNLVGDFDALELDGVSCQWTASSAGGGVADCADPFLSTGILAYQVTLDQLAGVPPDPYYQLEITNLATVPEPGTLNLLGPSIGVLFWLRRRRRFQIARLP